VLRPVVWINSPNAPNERAFTLKVMAALLPMCATGQARLAKRTT
jgi:hypothetical protein